MMWTDGRFLVATTLAASVTLFTACSCHRQAAGEGGAVLGAATVSAPSEAAATSRPLGGATTRPFQLVADQAHLQNAHVVTAKVIAGAQPEGDASFEALRRLGVRTIVSVDGAKPDVEGARKFGLTYVHLPITYSGVSAEEGKAIAKALDELPGPIYVHCHHGKHRSAAAVAVACVYNGSLPPAEAEEVLRTFGTGENYKGLWQAARDARPVPAGELRTMKVEFVEARKIGPLAETMVAIDERSDHLKAIQKAGWRTPKDHPDLDPPHEALQLVELLREIRRSDTKHANNAEFSRLLGEAESAAERVQRVLADNAGDVGAADAAFVRLGASCAACHRGFRD